MFVSTNKKKCKIKPRTPNNWKEISKPENPSMSQSVLLSGNLAVMASWILPGFSGLILMLCVGWAALLKSQRLQLPGRLPLSWWVLAGWVMPSAGKDFLALASEWLILFLTLSFIPPPSLFFFALYCGLLLEPKAFVFSWKITLGSCNFSWLMAWQMCHSQGREDVQRNLKARCSLACVFLAQRAWGQRVWSRCGLGVGTAVLRGH